MNGPHRNRVTPLSEVAAINLRGAWMGNRGILHVGTDIVRSHASNLWITCVLTFKDWRAAQWEPHHYTVLFFHDEAVSLAAGHRPCALCRRGDYNNFRSALADATGSGIPSAKDLDRRLHSERIIPGTHRRRLHRHDWQTLPAGSFVLVDAVPILVLADRMVPWSTDGYGPARERPASGEAEVITPSSSVAALRAGYVPQIDATALGEG